MPSFLDKSWLVSNVIYSENKYTLRGLHYQTEPYEQAKLIKVIKGKIFNFYFDMRSLSVNYGRCGGETVKENYEILIPRGFAHGFITLEDDTIVQYLVDNIQHVDSENSILWSSIPSLVNELEKKIPNFELSDVITSDKDKKGQKMVDWLNRKVIKE